MAKEAIGIKNFRTYRNTLNDLVAFGFIKMIEVSKNQYSSNIIALSNFDKALDKALDKAIVKATKKQSESTSKSIDSIDKQLTINKKPLTIEERKLKFAHTLNEFSNIYDRQLLKDFYEYWTETNENGKKLRREMQKTWNSWEA